MVAFLWLMSFLVLALFIVVFTIRYKETLPSRGVLESVHPTLEVVSPSSARVVEVLVDEGQSVVAGDLLALLSTEVLNGSGVRQEELSIAQLEMKIALIEKENLLSAAMYTTKNAQIASRISVVKNRLKSLGQSVLLSTERLRVNDANLKSFAKLLETANVSALQHNQQQLHFLEAAQYANKVKLDRLETESKLSDLRLEGEALEIQYLTTKTEYEQKIELLRHEIEALTSRHLIKIVSSSDGIVTGMAIKEGMSVAAQQHLMQVRDPDNSTIATLFVSSRIIGLLHTEQAIRLSFDSFPVNEYGYYNATIIEIAGTPLDPRQSSIPVQNSNRPVFKVIAELEKNYVDGTETHPLRSGYEFTAHVVTEDLTLLEYVFKPLISLREKSL